MATPAACAEEQERDDERVHVEAGDQEREVKEMLGGGGGTNGCDLSFAAVSGDDDGNEEEDGDGDGDGDGIGSGGNEQHPNGPHPIITNVVTKEVEVVHHPLENPWTFWFDNPSAKNKQAPWGSSIRPIHTFSTVEEFWSVYNNINRPSKLVVGADFHCFKYKIEPKWEDPICADGGKWTISCVRGKSDTWWLYTLLAMIGEQFDHGDEICGAVVNVRGKQEKIALWTKNASNEAAQMSIGRQWKEFLDYNESIGFIFHEDAKRHERSARNRYVIP